MEDLVADAIRTREESIGAELVSRHRPTSIEAEPSVVVLGGLEALDVAAVLGRLLEALEELLMPSLVDA